MNDVLDELKSLFSATINSVDSDRIKTFYIDEVVVPAQSYLPVLMVIGNTTNIIAKSTSKDQFTYGITIRVVVDIKKLLKSAGTGTTINAQNELKKIMEERNSDQTLKADTVLGILRANIKGTDYLFNNDITTTYTSAENWPYVIAECELIATTNLISRP